MKSGLLRDTTSWLVPVAVSAAIALPIGGAELAFWSYLARRLGMALSALVIAAAVMIVALALARLFGRLSIHGGDSLGPYLTYPFRMVPFWVREIVNGGSPGNGKRNERFVSEKAFAKADRRRHGPDQWDYGVHWSDRNVSSGLRLTWIEKTNELVVVEERGRGGGDGPVELLAKLDRHRVDRALRDWEYAGGTRNSLRWARRRATGWPVPLPPSGEKWKRRDARPPIAWPSPPPPSVGDSTGAYLGVKDERHRQVEVSDTRGRRPLYQYVESSPTGMSWGYTGAGPTDLARSILADRLGYVPQPPVYYAFRGQVIAKLADEFQLTFSQVDDWIDSHKALFAPNPRAMPFDPFAAGGR